MKPFSLLSLALVGAASAQSRTSLTDALDSKNDTLSELNGINDALEALLNDTTVAKQVAADPGLIGAILQYHVLNGTYYASNITDTPAFVKTLLTNETYTNVTSGQVVEAVAANDTVSFYSGLRAQSNNLNFTGGTIHIINRVLSIPKNLTDTAIAANLSAVVGAFTEADLGEDVIEEKNITVFAPNNAAFADIGSVVGNLSSDDLESILKYHVVNGTVGYSSTLRNGTLRTSEGEDITIAIHDGDVFVNEAKVVIPDVLIANGVLHVIDGENPSATANPTAETQAPAFSGASSASDVGVPFTSGVPQGTEQVTGLTTSTSTEAAPHATAAIALGALLGGAAVVMNY
ncbi:hypothetical protein LRP88_12298 [Fusarium phalaenopsidis]